MFNFDYYNPTRILFGGERIADVGKHIPEDARVLITYGGGSAKKYGTLEEVKKALAPRDVLEFGGIEANPRLDTLLSAARLAKEKQVDFLLAVGGGSVIDGTKFIAAAAHYSGDAWKMWTDKLSPERVLPLGCVLTLPATGSEMNATAVVSNPAQAAKVGYKHPSLFPRFAVLDPHKSFTLPPRQIANGVVDAFVHVTEQYLTYPVYGKVQDRFAEGLLLTLVEEGPLTLTEPENYDARASVMWAATLALNGLIGTGVPQDWATHRIGHQLTALYNLDHAQTLAVLLPSVLQVQKADKQLKLAQFAERVWGIRDGNEEQKAQAAIGKTRDFFEDMGLKTRLSAYGIAEDAIDKVLDNLERLGVLPLGERGDIDKTAARRILSMSY